MDFAINTSDRSTVAGFCTKFNTVPLVDDEAADNWLYTPVDRIVYMILLPFVVAFGLVGNGAFLFMVARLARMKTIVNFFLVNLAITDMTFLITQSLFLIYLVFSSQVIYRYPFKSTESCVTIYFIGYLSYYCSISLITLISIERFYAVCHPLKHRTMQSKGHTSKALAVVYVTSTVLAVITVMKRMKIHEFCLKWPESDRYEKMPMVFRYCGPLLGNQGIVVMTEIMYSVLFFIAAIVNGFMYGKIIMALGSRSIAEINETEIPKISIRNQVAKALVINGIIFFITQLPMRVNDINETLEALGEPQFLSPTQKANSLSFSGLFLFLNSALNPYVYAFSSSNYRQGFKDAFSFLFKGVAKDSETSMKPTISSISNMKTLGN